jgi:hypothetical protein
LEIASAFAFAFAFQGSRWLGDIAPHLLSEAQRAGLARAKVIAGQRTTIEDLIPDHLLYERGWPKVRPSAEEAELLWRVRRQVSALYGMTVSCMDPAELIARYSDLMAQKAVKNAAALKKASAKKRTRWSKGNPG